MASKPKTFGRRFVDISQKARGRVPFRYEFEIIPYFVGEIPPGHDRVLFVWERGTKLFVTDAEAVNPKTRAVFWKQYLRQTITVYKAGGSIVKKEYTFKIQSVKENSEGEQERTTLGKTHLDLSLYCTGQTDPTPQEVFLHLKPHGRLKVSVKATWLKDAKIDADAMTELSCATEEYGEETGQYLEDNEPYNEQDLSGFENGDGGKASSSGRGHRGSSRSQDGDGGGGEDDGGGDGSGRQRSSRSGRSKGKSRSRNREGGGGRHGDSGDPDEMRRIQEVDNEMDHPQGEDAEEYDRMVAEITAQVRTEVQPVQSGGTFCCCFPRKQHIQVDAQEVASLLKKPGTQMSHMRS